MQFVLGSPDSGCLPITAPMLVCPNRQATPIIGYNVIETIIKSNDGIVDDLRHALPLKSVQSVQSFVNLVCEDDVKEIGDVKMGRNNIVIVKNSRQIISCRVRVGSVTNKFNALFIPNPEMPWAEDLCIPETVVIVSEGNSSKVSIPVFNTSNWDLVLGKRVLLGHIELVQSVVNLPAREDLGKWSDTVSASCKISQQKEVGSDGA
ncbi:hypothetical protein HOLleu_39282 [Holothuria leucospilota]|uniref:Uncharacterized protein n=1 Tax=Holothuria leucospilota TaxID=206669 RepID=A0A9Q0YFS6_HOLLE|nr:hypothetical protein HOLleu_39282 [Holothuria leucospilota]